jgi:uncharacterized protein YdeI (YjbR/CyaY-like superfamily)
MTADATPMIEVTDRREWRGWLAANHTASHGIWLVFWKKHTGRQGLTYGEAVEEAICFGWIDGVLRRLDEGRFAQRFSPRRDRLTWSESNRTRLRRLLAAGQVTEAGLAAIDPSVLARLDEPAPPRPDPVLDAELEARLREVPAAIAAFGSLSAAQRRLHVAWVMDAKRQATRQRRLEEVIELLAGGRVLGLK